MAKTSSLMKVDILYNGIIRERLHGVDVEALKHLLEKELGFSGQEVNVVVEVWRSKRGQE